MKSDDYRRLVASGMSPDQIALVMELMDAKEEERKAQQRARWRKHQQTKKNANVSEREQTLANVPRAGDARVEDKPLPTETNKVKKHTHSADLEAFKAALAGGCDSERIESFVKLRRAKRGQLTEHAAKLFIADAQACGLSLPAAIDTCVSRNWITVKPDWLAKPNARAGPKPGSAADVLMELGGRMRDAEQGGNDRDDAGGFSRLAVVGGNGR